MLWQRFCHVLCVCSLLQATLLVVTMQKCEMQEGFSNIQMTFQVWILFVHLLLFYFCVSTLLEGLFGLHCVLRLVGSNKNNEHSFIISTVDKCF